MEDAEASHQAMLAGMSAASEALQMQIGQQEATIQEVNNSKQELEATMSELQAALSERRSVVSCWS